MYQQSTLLIIDYSYYGTQKIKMTNKSSIVNNALKA